MLLGLCTKPAVGVVSKAFAAGLVCKPAVGVVSVVAEFGGCKTTVDLCIKPSSPSPYGPQRGGFLLTPKNNLSLLHKAVIPEFCRPQDSGIFNACCFRKHTEMTDAWKISDKNTRG